MRYSDRSEGYDSLKWGLAPNRRKRSAWTKWSLGLGLALVLAYAALAVARPQGDMLFPNPALMMPVIIGASLSPFARSPWLTARGRSVYDEFERAAYARATIVAYLVFVGLILATFGYLAAATAWGWPRPLQAGQWVTLLWTALLVAVGLPLLFAEIMVPLPPPAEDWEDDA